MARHSSHMLDLARRGAEVRLHQLAREARNLMDIFPHLGDEFDADELPVSFILAEGARQQAEAPARRKGRRAAGGKKYWTGRRKIKARS